MQKVSIISKSSRPVSFQWNQKRHEHSDPCFFRNVTWQGFIHEWRLMDATLSFRSLQRPQRCLQSTDTIHGSQAQAFLQWCVQQLFWHPWRPHSDCFNILEPAGESTQHITSCLQALLKNYCKVLQSCQPTIHSQPCWCSLSSCIFTRNIKP